MYPFSHHLALRSFFFRFVTDGQTDGQTLLEDAFRITNVLTFLTAFSLPTNLTRQQFLALFIIIATTFVQPTRCIRRATTHTAEVLTP